MALSVWLGIAFMLAFVVLNDLKKDHGIRMDGGAVVLVSLLALLWPAIMLILLVGVGPRRLFRGRL